MVKISGVAGSVAARYQGFAAREARGVSNTYETWANSVARDAAVLTRLEELPVPKQQPNLVFAAARHHGARSSYESFRSVLSNRWADVRRTVLSRSTQTNEAARCAVLLPYLAALPQPLALIEVGASAGLCLLPDRYSYRYPGGAALDPVDGRSPVLLTAELGAGVPAPSQLPQIAWRVGIDLAPIDVTDPEACSWLETLIWPEHQERRERLRRALSVAEQHPPRIVSGNLLDELPRLAAQAPADATLVIFHSAVLAYLDPGDRGRFVELVRGLPGHWISNEGHGVVNRLPLPFQPAQAFGRFILAVDGEPRALTDPYGREVTGLRVS